MEIVQILNCSTGVQEVLIYLIAANICNYKHKAFFKNISYISLIAQIVYIDTSI